MHLKIGDFVRFVDENLEGYITRIIDKETIGVTDANDFEIPVMASKVTLIHGEIPKNGPLATSTPVNIAPEVFVKEGVSLGLVSDQHISSVAHFHLVNDSSFTLLASLTTERNGAFNGEYSGIVKPHSSTKIYAANMSDIQLWPKFKLEILFNAKGDVEPLSPLIYHQSIKGKDLSVSKVDIPLLKTKGWSIRLDTSAPVIDAEKLKNSFFK
ncbi:hypothetical protein [Pedobacter sp. JCM 36344]|uniref:hypothetical protein n=1 Tax=Pedobacter sp. JCM 36344 TaxID=3374280 RepID=UPI003979D452